MQCTPQIAPKSCENDDDFVQEISRIDDIDLGMNEALEPTESGQDLTKFRPSFSTDSVNSALKS